jgi:PAS domain S-box-containing protein
LAGLLFDDSRDGLLLVDLHGRIAAANAEWLLLSGDSPEDVDRCPIELLGGAGAPQTLADLFTTARAMGTPQHAVLSHRHRHGFDIELEVAVEPILDDTGRTGIWLIRARPTVKRH